MKGRLIKVGILFFLIAGLIVGVMFLPYLGRGFLEHVGVLRPTIPVAIYEDMGFKGRDELTTMSTLDYYSDGPPKVPHLYVLVDDHDPILLQSFPEELAASMLEIRDDAWNDNPNDTRYSLQDSMIFRDGKLVSAIFDYPSAFRVSPTKQGPFLEFPIEKKMMIKTFGKPIEWERSRVWLP